MSRKIKLIGSITYYKSSDASGLVVQHIPSYTSPVTFFVTDLSKKIDHLSPGPRIGAGTIANVIQMEISAIRCG